MFPGGTKNYIEVVHGQSVKLLRSGAVKKTSCGTEEVMYSFPSFSSDKHRVEFGGDVDAYRTLCAL